MTDTTSSPAAGGAESQGDVLVDTGEHHHLAGAGVIKRGYAPRLTNEDLAPLRKQTWGSYNFFAFWMSDWTVSSLVDRQLILPGSADRRNGYGIDTTSVHR